MKCCQTCWLNLNHFQCIYAISSKLQRNQTSDFYHIFSLTLKVRSNSGLSGQDGLRTLEIWRFELSFDQFQRLQSQNHNLEIRNLEFMFTIDLSNNCNFGKFGESENSSDDTVGRIDWYRHDNHVNPMCYIIMIRSCHLNRHPQIKTPEQSLK